MLKDIIIAALLLLIGVLYVRQTSVSNSVWNLQKKYEQAYLLIDKNDNTNLHRVVDYGQNNNIELGHYSFHYERIKKNSVLVPEKEGRWLVFDSTNNLQEIKWFQQNKLFYQEYYVGDKGSSSLDTFYSDSFDIKRLERPTVKVVTSTQDSNKLQVSISSWEFPSQLFKVGCDCMLRYHKRLRHQNKNIYIANKRNDGKPLELNVRYHNWETTYERTDRYSLEY